MLAVFGEFNRMVGVGFVLQKAFVALVPPDDVAFGIADAGAGADLFHGIGFVVEGDAGVLLADGGFYRGAAVAGVGKLACHGHAMGFGLRGWRRGLLRRR